MNPFRPERLRAIAVAALLVLPGLAFAAGNSKPSPQVVEIRDRWAEVTYNTPKPQRVAALESLASRSESLRKAQPKDANALIWDGIVLSSLAGERGGLGALGLVKQARANFEAALAIDPTALDGAAYTSLGALYYQVPGWPVGFGDDKKARQLLRKGIEVNPDGLDANFFYADFLRDQGDWKGAAAALQKALAAPARPGSEVADRGRRMEATALLAEVKPHLASR